MRRAGVTRAGAIVLLSAGVLAPVAQAAPHSCDADATRSSTMPACASATLPAVVVTGDVVAPSPAVRVGSTSRRDADDVRAAGPGLDLSEVLRDVPGVFANNRGNYAQDTQLSVRGYGARATFGVRGVRLYVNGIPATAPDGQGQIAHVAIDGIARVEVLRGPLAALYGNAAGAVIKVDGSSGADGAEGGLSLRAGEGFDRGSLAWRGGDATRSAAVVASRLDVDGERPHAAARRETLDATARLALGDWQLALAANAYDSPFAQDPLGLAPAQWRDDPGSVAPAALQFDTRKRVTQQQAGASLTRDGSSGIGVRIAPYAGRRDVVQFLAVPVAAQQNPLSGGGVVDLARDFAGLETRVWHRRQTAAGAVTLALGANVDALREHRRGYENFVGADTGVRGALRRDERDRVRGVDLVGTVEWQPAERWRVVGGVRANRITLTADDRYVAPGNPDDGGDRRFRNTNPALGVFFDATDALALHASAARASEVPTLNELAYRVDGSAGLNFALHAARATRREVGATWTHARGRVALAAFDDDGRDELAVARSQGGRTSYRNVDRSERRGVELELTHDFSSRWHATIGWTHLDATLGGDGARLPGVPGSFGEATVAWTPTPAWRIAVEARGVAHVFADDANTVAAPSYRTFGIDVSRAFAIGDDTLALVARVDNLDDERYVGSVIVNEANGRAFEPAPGRTWSIGAEYRWR